MLGEEMNRKRSACFHNNASEGQSSTSIFDGPQLTSHLTHDARIAERHSTTVLED